MDVSVARANAIIAVVFVVMVGLSVEHVRERFLPMYDDASSFSRIEPRPGWIDTGIVIEENRPIGIIVSGTLSSNRLTHETASEPNKPYEIGPDGLEVAEELLPDWREVDALPAFALLARVNGGKPFMVRRTRTIAFPGKLELKVNCLLWDKTIRFEPGTMQPRRKGKLTVEELGNLRAIRGFFAYRTWVLGAKPPRQPHVPLTAAEITKRYGES